MAHPALVPLALAFLACANSAETPAATEHDSVLIVIMDDLGVDAVRAYGVSQDAPETPTLSRLAREGVLFRNAYAYPYCSPTRAALMTGRYGFRTGIGYPIVPQDPSRLRLREWTLPEALAAGSDDAITSAAFGKWHLGNEADAAREAGFSHFAGSPGNLWWGGQDFEHWWKLVDGEPEVCERYATSEVVDDALAWLDTTPGPFCAWVAFHAVHEPWHAPPEELHSIELPAAGPDEEPRPYFDADLQAMDRELGRLLAGLGERAARTHVIVLGDNGTTGAVARAPVSGLRAKGTLHEGGVRVPLIVVGPALVDGGREVTDLVDVTDVFPTVLELAGVELDPARSERRPLDGKSFAAHLRAAGAAPRRTWILSEAFLPNHPGDEPEWGGRALREGRHKLLVTLPGNVPSALYDLSVDPWEHTNLLDAPTPEALSTRDSLRARLLEILDS